MPLNSTSKGTDTPQAPAEEADVSEIVRLLRKIERNQRETLLFMVKQDRERRRE